MKRLFWTLTAMMWCCAQPGLALPANTLRTITVSGQARAQIPPDRVEMTLAVESKHARLDEAKKDNDEKLKRLLAVVAQFNIPKDQLSTSSVYISPDYSYEQNGKPKMIGYTVSRTFQLKIDGMETHERILSKLLEAKIDQIPNIAFVLSNPEQIAAKLRLEAFKDAKQKAAALAKEAGATLGSVITLSAADEGMPAPMPMMMKAMQAQAAAVSQAPTIAGLVPVYAAVSVMFSLE